MSLRRALEYVEDVGSYLRTFSTRMALKRPGGGEDYSQDGDQQTAWRVVDGLHPDQMRLRVVERIEETSSTQTLRFERVDGELPPFRAGQYVNLFTEVQGVRTSRPYSISSKPGSDRLDLTIKVDPEGFVSPHLGTQVEVGDELVSTGLSGSFYYETLIHGRDLVFIAGGSGITPFMSMLQSMTEQDDPPRVHLLYGSRREEEVIFHRAIEDLDRSQQWLTVTQVITEPSLGWGGEAGLIDRAMIERTVGDVRGKMFYICGPNGLYAAAESALLELGVERHRILREQFGAPADITEEPSWPEGVDVETEFDVEIQGYGRIRARAGESLLTSLERHDINLPTVCRTGSCSSCRVQVLEGPSFTLANAGVREADQRDGFTHACVTYPVGDMTLKP